MLEGNELEGEKTGSCQREAEDIPRVRSTHSSLHLGKIGIQEGGPVSEGLSRSEEGGLSVEVCGRDATQSKGQNEVRAK